MAVPVSIIVPARNEAGTIARIAQELPSLGSKTEIIFVEGHSRDNTWEEIQRVLASYTGPHTLRALQQTGIGKGNAVREGFSVATGDIFVIYDADMSVPTYELQPFVELLATKRAGFTNGSRFIYPMEHGAMRSLNYAGNLVFSFLLSIILGQKITDTLCGTKALWKADYQRIVANRKYFGEFDPFGDYDLLFGAARLHLSICDVPVHYQARVYGTTNISRWKHGWLLLTMTARALWYFKLRPLFDRVILKG